MHGWDYAIFLSAGFLSSIMSGISGAGGGFIMTPLGILLGLSPAQAVSTGKISGLSVTVGSLFGLKAKHGIVAWNRIIPIMILAGVVGLLVPFIIQTMDSRVYRLTLGIMLILMIPFVLYKKVGIKNYHPSRLQRWIGGLLLSTSLVLQGVFSGGLGTLVNIVLMTMLGMTALEANITKRWSQLILNITIILGLLGSGLILWHVAALGVISTFTGSYIGGKMATKKR